MLLPTFRNGEGTGAVRLAFAVAAVHLLAVAGVILADWQGAIRQLRGISRIQIRKWAWCRIVCRFTYRDSAAYWRTCAILVFVPGGLAYLIVAYTG
jgi:hypothetical protein